MTPEDQAHLELETRSFEFRAQSVDIGKREIVGRAVPYGVQTTISHYMVEEFARGSVQDSSGALAFWRHNEPIGKLIADKNEDGGWDIIMRVSKTQRGDEALTLAADGVVTQLSVGFEPGCDRTIQERENDIPIVTRTRVKVREVSLVPFGQYGDGATVTEVRERQPNPTKKENKMDPEEIARLERAEADLLVVREHNEELERRFTQLTQRTEEPQLDTRSAGEFLRDLAAGDETTVRAYNTLQERAYTGGTSADAPIRDQWAGDLTRIFDSSSGVLADTFSTGTLPDKGNVIEFGELASNTVQVNEQVDEGDDLAFGKVTLTTRTAPVKTYGGYTQLTRQAILRSTLPLLDRSLEALAVAAAARKKAVLRSAFGAVVTAREAIAANGGVILLGATLAASTAGHWEDALIDAALRYDLENVSPEKLIVSASVFKKLRSLTVAGERVFTVHEKNASGTLDLPGLSGNLAGLPVRLDPGQAGDKAQFVHSRAIRAYDSGLVSLQDENIINLSKDFSVYRFGAVAAEIPQFVVPVKLAAA